MIFVFIILAFIFILYFYIRYLIYDEYDQYGGFNDDKDIITNIQENNDLYDYAVDVFLEANYTELEKMVNQLTEDTMNEDNFRDSIRYDIKDNIRKSLNVTNLNNISDLDVKDFKFTPAKQFVHAMYNLYRRWEKPNLILLIDWQNIVNTQVRYYNAMNSSHQIPEKNSLDAYKFVMNNLRNNFIYEYKDITYENYDKFKDQVDIYETWVNSGEPVPYKYFNSVQFVIVSKFILPVPTHYNYNNNELTINETDVGRILYYKAFYTNDIKSNPDTCQIGRNDISVILAGMHSYDNYYSKEFDDYLLLKLFSILKQREFYINSTRYTPTYTYLVSDDEKMFEKTYDDAYLKDIIKSIPIETINFIYCDEYESIIKNYYASKATTIDAYFQNNYAFIADLCKRLNSIKINNNSIIDRKSSLIKLKIDIDELINKEDSKFLTFDKFIKEYETLQKDIKISQFPHLNLVLDKDSIDFYKKILQNSYLLLILNTLINTDIDKLDAKIDSAVEHLKSFAKFDKFPPYVAIYAKPKKPLDIEVISILRMNSNLFEVKDIDNIYTSLLGKNSVSYTIINNKLANFINLTNISSISDKDKPVIDEWFSYFYNEFPSIYTKLNSSGMAISSYSNKLSILKILWNTMISNLTLSTEITTLSHKNKFNNILEINKKDYKLKENITKGIFSDKWIHTTNMFHQKTYASFKYSLYDILYNQINTYVNHNHLPMSSYAFIKEMLKEVNRASIDLEKRESTSKYPFISYPAKHISGDQLKWRHSYFKASYDLLDSFYLIMIPLYKNSKLNIKILQNEVTIINTLYTQFRLSASSINHISKLFISLYSSLALSKDVSAEWSNYNPQQTNNNHIDNYQKSLISEYNLYTTYLDRNPTSNICTVNKNIVKIIGYFSSKEILIYNLNPSISPKQEVKTDIFISSHNKYGHAIYTIKNIDYDLNFAKYLSIYNTKGLFSRYCEYINETENELKHIFSSNIQKLIDRSKNTFNPTILTPPSSIYINDVLDNKGNSIISIKNKPVTYQSAPGKFTIILTQKNTLSDIYSYNCFKVFKNNKLLNEQCVESNKISIDLLSIGTYEIHLYKKNISDITGSLTKIEINVAEPNLLSKKSDTYVTTSKNKPSSSKYGNLV